MKCYIKRHSRFHLHQTCPQCRNIFYSVIKYLLWNTVDITHRIFFFNFEMQWHYDRLNGNTVKRTLWTFASKRLLKRDAGIKELFKFSSFLSIKIHTYQHIDTETAKAVALKHQFWQSITEVSFKSKNVGFLLRLKQPVVEMLYELYPLSDSNDKI